MPESIDSYDWGRQVCGPFGVTKGDVVLLGWPSWTHTGIFEIWEEVRQEVYVSLRRHPHAASSSESYPASRR